MPRLRLLAFLFLCCALAVAQARRPMTFKDMMALKRISDPVVSPDGRWALFSAVHVDLQANARIPHLWILPLAGGEARQLTNGKTGESRGRFSPDGKRILFQANREGGTQVWVGDFDRGSGELSGDPKRVTDISTEVDSPAWTPDGRSIIFLSEVWPQCSNDACNKERDEAKSKSMVKARLYDHLLYRHWNQWDEGKRRHLFIVPADGGEARQLTRGEYDATIFSLGGQDLFAVSPDGQEVAFTSNHDKALATSTNSDLFAVSTQGSKERKLTANPAWDGTLLYSPDGRYIAYRAQRRPGFEADKFELMLLDRQSGQSRSLTQNFDQWVESFVWAPDSQKLYIASPDKGEQPIYELSVSGGQPRELVRGTNDELQITPDGKTLVFTRQSAEAPNEVYKLDITAQQPVALSHLNREVFAEVHTSPAEPFWFKGAANTQIHGYIVKPPDFDPAKTYPVKFILHGGPQTNFGDSWSYRWNPQLFASDGYVVLMINRRGSTSYGQKFIDEISGDWGGKAYVDLMRGLDYALARNKYMNGDRVCAMGASYGGYMAAWILGHTGRFNCIVAHDAVFNIEAMHGATEELWFPEWDMKGAPWENPQMYARWSPHKFVTKFQTPTLVVHGLMDYRVDPSQGMMLFTALQRKGIPSKLLLFPDEGHWVLKPLNSQFWYKTVNDWVAQWLKVPVSSSATAEPAK